MLVRFSSLVLAVAAIVDVANAWGADSTSSEWQDWGGDPWAPAPAPGPDPSKPDPGLNKDCLCKEYLKDKSWDYLHKFGIKMENFCCLVGAVSYCLDTPHIAGGYVKVEAVEGKPVSEAAYYPPVDYSNYGYKIPYNLYRCIDQAGIGKLAHYYPDTYSTSGTYVAGDGGAPYNQATEQLTEEEKKQADASLTKGVGYGYNPRPACSWSYNYASYIKCIFTIYFDQAKQACYCYYRTKVHCVCDDCDKDVKLDRSIAYYNPELICNQCPDNSAKPEPKDPLPYGYKPEPKGYEVYVTGEPYDPCAGYCMLISGYDSHYD